MSRTRRVPRRRLRNLPRDRQRALRERYPWLARVHRRDRVDGMNIVSVSVFDHWLSCDEARALLEHVPPAEQARRDTCHAAFCAALTERTEVLSFEFRGLRKDRPVFRAFASEDALRAYCTPGGGPTLRHGKFHVLLPELDCVFYEGWDDTHHVYVHTGDVPGAIAALASACGLHLLDGE